MSEESMSLPLPEEQISISGSINIPEIYENILPYTDKSSKARLMRTSREWYELAGPLLYEEMIHFVEGTQSDTPKDSFACFPPSSTEASCTKLIQRTPKVELLKYCKIIRSTPGKPQVIDPELSSTLRKHLNPKTLVFQYPNLELSLKSQFALFGQGYEDSEAYHIFIGLSPGKLVIKNWLSRWGIRYRFPTMSFLPKVVIILSPDAPIETDYPIIVLSPFVRAGAEVSSVIVIFQEGKQEDSNHGPIPIWPLWAENLARDTARYINASCEHRITFVNSDATTASTYTGGETFRNIVQRCFFLRCTWVFIQGEDVQLKQPELEERWSRVKFMTKEEYMNQDPEELEGELDNIVW